MHCGQTKSAKTNHLLGALLASICAASAMLSLPAVAQTAAKPSDEMERAQRDADKVFKMILINSDAPRKKRAPDAGTAAANTAAPAAVVKAPAATGNSPAAMAAALAQRAGDGSRTDATLIAPAAAAAAAPAPTAASALQVATAPELATPVPTPAAAVLAPAPSAASVVDDEEDDSPLALMSQVRPTYRPALMRELGKGTVRVKFEVQPDGSVAKQEVVTSSNRGLNSATLAAVGQWKFQPIKTPREAQVELGFNVDQ